MQTFAALLLTMVLTLELTFLEVFILGHYDPPSTARIPGDGPL